MDARVTGIIDPRREPRPVLEALKEKAQEFRYGDFKVARSEWDPARHVEVFTVLVELDADIDPYSNLIAGLTKRLEHADGVQEILSFDVLI